MFLKVEVRCYPFFWMKHRTLRYELKTIDNSLRSLPMTIYSIIHSVHYVTNGINNPPFSFLTKQRNFFIWISCSHSHGLPKRTWPPAQPFELQILRGESRLPAKYIQLRISAECINGRNGYEEKRLYNHFCCHDADVYIHGNRIYISIYRRLRCDSITLSVLISVRFKTQIECFVASNVQYWRQIKHRIKRKRFWNIWEWELLIFFIDVRMAYSRKKHTEIYVFLFV